MLCLPFSLGTHSWSCVSLTSVSRTGGAHTTEPVGAATFTEGQPVQPRLSRWFLRTVILGLATIYMCIERIKLNGGSQPMFRYNSNRFGLNLYDPGTGRFNCKSFFG